MTQHGKQKAAIVLAGLLLVISGAQLHETFSAVHYWWSVNHPDYADFVVPKWWTNYTVASAAFAPIWLACIGAALALSRRWPLVAVVTLASFLIIEPMSCASAPSVDRTSGGFLGLEDLPFASAERAADWRHLDRIDQRLKQYAGDTGSFPTSYEQLKAVVGESAFENSPYQQGGRSLRFDLKFLVNQGVPFVATPERPGIVYYAVNSNGRQFVLTISGLNAPVSGGSSMMKAEAFVGEKQPWGGLLAAEESLYRQ